MSDIKIFENKKVRSHWDAERETWFFSVIDIIEILTGSTIPKRYWADLKKKLAKEGSQLYEKIVQLKFEAADGKKYATDCLDTPHLFRVIQSIPSPKAEPFKQWLAKVGYERLQEMNDPSQSIDRARENWQESGVKKGDEFAALTNIIHQEWTGLTVKEHKDLKGLKSQNLRDHMSEAELIFTALAELSTRQIAETTKAKGIQENALASKKGGAVAKNARKELESKTDKRVVTGENFLPPAKDKKKLK